MKWFRILTVFVGMSVLSLFFQNCGGFNSSELSSSDVGPTDPDPDQNPDPTDPVTPPPQPDVSAARGLQIFNQNCAGCHGLIDTTTVLNRTRNHISSAISSVPAMSVLRGALTDADLQALETALNREAPIDTDPSTGRATFACDAGTMSRTPLLKLTHREFRNTITALLNDVSTALVADSRLNELFNALPSDTIVQNRDTLKEQSLLVTQAGVNAGFDVSFRAAELISASSALSSYPNTNGCLASSTITRDCFNSFVREFSTRAFRRPVTANESVEFANQFWDGTLNKANQLQFAVTALTQMPEFYYKIYDRGGSAGASNTLALTNHELASKVSYFLTGAPPDSTLRGVANSGQISDPAVLRAQVDRLLNTTASQDTIQRLFRESYGYNVYDTFNYPTSFLNGINTNNLSIAMTQELDTFFANQVLSRNATFSDLLTSRNSTFTHTGLAAIYGVTAGTNITLPAERAGFINRASVLSKRSGVRTSPIKRGLAMLEHALCVDVGLPPPSAPTALPPYEGEILSTRQATSRVSEAAGTTCVGCHSRINSLGFAFENFDTLGRVRSQESLYNGMGNITNYLPINTVATTQELGTRAVTVNHSADLARELGQSDRGIMCFAKHLKAFEARVPAATTDHCQMNVVLDTMYGQGSTQGSIRSAIQALILSDDFKKWRY